MPILAALHISHSHWQNPTATSLGYGNTYMGTAIAPGSFCPPVQVSNVSVPFSRIRLRAVVRTNAAEQPIQPPFDTTSNEGADEAIRPGSGAVQCSVEHGAGLLASAVG